jgi:hypothetical protein
MLEVLNQHCDTVGRDPAEITKTRLGAPVIADTAPRHLGPDILSVVLSLLGRIPCARPRQLLGPPAWR